MHMPIQHRTTLVRLLLGLWLLLPGLAAQAQEAMPLAEADRWNGAPVREVIISGLDRTDERYVRNNLRSTKGTPFDAELTRRDVRSLTRLGRFSRIQASVLPYDDGSVAIIFALLEEPLIEDIQSVGNSVFSDGEVSEMFDLLPGAPADEFAIQRGLRQIEQAYRDKGYYLIRVEYDRKELDEAGIVYLRIREGPRVKVTDIRFEGNVNIADKALRGEIGSETSLWLLRKGEIDTDRIREDERKIAEHYIDHGYLQVRVGSELRLSSNNREAIITFFVDEGPRARLRRVIFDGNTVFTDEQLLARMSIRPGDPLLSLPIKESVDAMELSYGELGYTDFRLAHELLIVPEQPLADLVITLREGERYRTGLVVTRGNDITQDHVIRRDSDIRPDRPLGQTAIARTRRQLEQKRFWAPGSIKVTPLPPTPAGRGYRDVLIEMEETNTASIGFGALFSTDSGVLGQVEITQRNFAASDPPDSLDELLSGRAWRGGGQRFSILLQPGNEVQNYSISLVEPRILDTDFSFRVEGFLRTRFYDDWDERRLGGTFGFGRRLGERWNLSTSARFENVDISDIEKNSTVDLFAVEGENEISSVGAFLVRTTYDEPAFPTQGSRTELSVERFGLLGGDYNFTRINAEHTIFLPIAEDILGRRTVVSLETRASYIPEENEAPLFERFYLGGRSLRGFDFRSVSPRGYLKNGRLSDEHVGGRFLFKLSPEIRYPLLGDSMYGVAFIESGIVSNEVEFDPYRVSVGAGIRLKIPMFGPAPLAFDFAWPIVDAEGDESRLFTFAVDIPF